MQSPQKGFQSISGKMSLILKKNATTVRCDKKIDKTIGVSSILVIFIYNNSRGSDLIVSKPYNPEGKESLNL